ncbi:TonB family protein [Orbus sturtevantii]|uniref:TonB family protein n=1 Tax=Orbus sturtevantii TaxID=3074109 RepID=UPI00370DBCC3
MIAKRNNSKKNNLNSYISVSILIHLAIVGVLLWGAFFSARTVSMAGNDSIKAIMIDLSVTAAPEPSLVENTPKSENADDNTKDELVKINPKANKQADIEPDLIIEKAKLDKLPKSADPKLIIKDKSTKNEDHNQPQQRKTSKQKIRQEVIADKLADNAVAPTISNNTQYSATPAAINRNHPEYPRRALDLRIEGYVVAIYDIDANGRVENIRIAEAKPNNIFNKAVIQAMKQWKYQPIQAKDLTIKIVFNRNKSVDFDNV